MVSKLRVMATPKSFLAVLFVLALLGASCSRGTDDGADSGDDIATLEGDESTDDESTDGEGDDSDSEQETESGDDDGADDGAEATGEVEEELEPEEAALEFSQCMRDEGITDFPDLGIDGNGNIDICLLYTSPSPRDATLSRMPSSA